MTRNRTRINSLWLAAAGGAVVVVVPLLLGADGDDSSRLAANRRQIADMSAAERARLEQQYSEFRALPEAERDKLRRLHAELEADSGLQQVLDDYSRWLRTLSPWQRQELQREDDWSRRLEIVRQFREEQRAAQSRRSSEDRERFEWLWPMVRMSLWPNFPALTSGPASRADGSTIRRDLAPAMKIIEESLPQTARLDQQLRTAGEGTASRYVRVLTAALNHAGEQAGSSDSQFDWSRIDWPDPLLMDRILGSFSERDRKRFEDYRDLNEFVRSIDPDGKRLLLAVLANEIDRLSWAEVRELEPGQDDIHRLLIGLEPRRKAEIDFSPASERRRRVKSLYHRELRGEFWKEAGELVGLLKKIMPMLPGPPGGRDFRQRGPGGPGGPSQGDGRRGPGDERRESGRERSSPGEGRP
ncbi:MAG TPA: hypothetical protein VML55_01105 [Planctomycetaceae bacterium]|nr:hypothetical protein [Planctomycetaceae bacterium]